MRIKCNCGKELKITQKEIDKGAVFGCTSCGEYHYLDLVPIEDLSEYLKTTQKTTVVNK